jgi:hypothetical protein
MKENKIAFVFSDFKAFMASKLGLIVLKSTSTTIGIKPLNLIICSILGILMHVIMTSDPGSNYNNSNTNYKPLLTHKFTKVFSFGSLEKISEIFCS